MEAANQITIAKPSAALNPEHSSVARGSCESEAVMTRGLDPDRLVRAVREVNP